MIDVSKITEQLYIGSRIGHEHVDEIKVLNFDLIISMIGQLPLEEVYTKPPFNSIWIKTYDSFFTPIPIKKLLVGVEAALPIIHKGGKVLVFCMQGRRRSVTMAAAILIAMGYSAENAAKLLKESRKVATPDVWYVKWRIKSFEKYWQRFKRPVDQPTRGT